MHDDMSDAMHDLRDDLPDDLPVKWKEAEDHLRASTKHL